MKQIGNISNYYGGLWIFKKNGKCYWFIENYDTDFDDPGDWAEEIPSSLYRTLKKTWK